MSSLVPTCAFKEISLSNPIVQEAFPMKNGKEHDWHPGYAEHSDKVECVILLARLRINSWKDFQQCKG